MPGSTPAEKSISIRIFKRLINGLDWLIDITEDFLYKITPESMNNQDKFCIECEKETKRLRRTSPKSKFTVFTPTEIKDRSAEASKDESNEQKCTDKIQKQTIEKDENDGRGKNVEDNSGDEKCVLVKRIESLGAKKLLESPSPPKHAIVVQQKEEASYGLFTAGYCLAVVLPVSVVVCSLKAARKILYRLYKGPVSYELSPRKMAEIKHRRKLSPRKRLPAKNVSVLGRFSSLTQELLGRKTSVSDAPLTLPEQDLNSSPNKDDKGSIKRKHDEVESEDDQKDELNMLTMTLDDYNSDEDPSYQQPSEDSEDSLEYDTGSVDENSDPEPRDELLCPHHAVKQLANGDHSKGEDNEIEEIADTSPQTQVEVCHANGARDVYELPPGVEVTVGADKNFDEVDEYKQSDLNSSPESSTGGQSPMILYESEFSPGVEVIVGTDKNFEELDEDKQSGVNSSPGGSPGGHSPARIN